uniref:Uncharacterized protein n=1 Tax=Arion vulgaris TaxID=1028688 RepID=A0A0B7AHP1_9EUPU
MTVMMAQILMTLRQEEVFDEGNESNDSNDNGNIVSDDNDDGNSRVDDRSCTGDIYVLVKRQRRKNIILTKTFILRPDLLIDIIFVQTC